MSKRSKIFMVVAMLLGVVLAVLIFINSISVKIVNLDDKIDYTSMFNKADEINAIKGDVCYTISYEVDIAEIIEQFKKVKVNKEPILMKVTRKDEPILYSDNKLPSMTNYINIGEYFLCFNDEFTEFCGYWGPDSEYPKLYKVTNPKAAEKVFDIISNSESTRINQTLGITNVETGSYFDDVSLSIKNFMLEGNNHSIEIEMKNNSDKRYSFGIGKSLYYKQGNELILCRTFKDTEDRAWSVNAVARILIPNETSTMEYSFYLDDVTKEGTYRLETEAFWVEFELKKQPIE